MRTNIDADDTGRTLQKGGRDTMFLAAAWLVTFGLQRLAAWGLEIELSGDQQAAFTSGVSVALLGLWRVFRDRLLDR